jgi:hypothetical protein
MDGWRWLLCSGTPWRHARDREKHRFQQDLNLFELIPAHRYLPSAPEPLTAQERTVNIVRTVTKALQGWNSIALKKSCPSPGLKWFGRCSNTTSTHRRRVRRSSTCNAGPGNYNLVEQRFRETRKPGTIGGMVGGGCMGTHEGTPFGRQSFSYWDEKALVHQTLQSFDGQELEIMERLSISHDRKKLSFVLELSSGGRTVNYTEEFPITNAEAQP